MERRTITNRQRLPAICSSKKWIFLLGMSFFRLYIYISSERMNTVVNTINYYPAKGVKLLSRIGSKWYIGWIVPKTSYGCRLGIHQKHKKWWSNHQIKTTTTKNHRTPLIALHIISNVIPTINQYFQFQSALK
jgi:hypothetical protein